MFRANSNRSTARKLPVGPSVETFTGKLLMAFTDILSFSVQESTSAAAAAQADKADADI
jgi:hypothetical protein